MKRNLNFGSHISEETLEEYAFRRIPEPEAALIEEHLLVCEECQHLLAAVDDYILLMKTAARQPAPPRPVVLQGGSRRKWYAAGGAVAAGVAVAAMLPGLRRVEPPDAVDLISLRGVETPRIRANRRADLRIALADLPDASYRIEVVDASGRLVWSGMAASEGQRIRVLEPNALRAGKYWVRLYSAQGELLREFGLESA